MSAPTNIASNIAPSFNMVKKYFIASIVSFVVMCTLLVFNASDIGGHHFQPKLLAITHIATLGWITMIIFGAMFQLIPVVLEVKLFSERLARIQFWLYVAGIIGLVYGFWCMKFSIHLTASATLLSVAILLFIFNILATMGSVGRWNITGVVVLTGVLLLGVTAVAGLLLSVNLGYPFIGRIHLDFLKIHAHLGFIGWVVMVIMGVGLKLIPMFGLSHGFSTTPAKAAYVLLNLGLMGMMVQWTSGGAAWLLGVYIALLVLGILAFLIQLFLIFRLRMKRFLDLGMKHSAAAFGFFLVATVIGLLLAFIPFNEHTTESLVLSYGWVVLIAFFSFLIVGQMYKIVPFLVWFHTFSDKVGKEQVPLLKEMFNERIGEVQLWLLLAGVVGGVVGLMSEVDWMFRAGTVLLLAAAVLFAYNMFIVFSVETRHAYKRKRT